MHKKYKKYSGLNTGNYFHSPGNTKCSCLFFFLYTLGKNTIFLPGTLYEFATVGVVDFFISVVNAHCNECALDFCSKLNK